MTIFPGKRSGLPGEQGKEKTIYYADGRNKEYKR